MSGTLIAILTGEKVTACRVAEDLRRSGSRGLINPSVRAPAGNCLVCFEPGAIQNMLFGATWDLTWNGIPEYSLLAVA